MKPSVDIADHCHMLGANYNDRRFYDITIMEVGNRDGPFKF